MACHFSIAVGQRKDPVFLVRCRYGIEGIPAHPGKAVAVHPLGETRLDTTTESLQKLSLRKIHRPKQGQPPQALLQLDAARLSFCCGSCREPLIGAGDQ